MSFSLNESDAQRIAIVVTIVGFNRRNQQKHKKDDDYRHAQTNLTEDILLSLSILFHILDEFDSVSSTHSVLTEKFRKGYTLIVDFLRFRLIYMLVTRQSACLSHLHPDIERPL